MLTFKLEMGDRYYFLPIPIPQKIPIFTDTDTNTDTVFYSPSDIDTPKNTDTC